LCSGVPASERQHMEVKGAGHYGIFSGRRWRDIVYPQVVKFIHGHAPKAGSAKATPVKAATVKAAPAKAAPAKKAVKTAAKTAAKAAAKTATKATPVVKTKWVPTKSKA